MDRKIDFLIIGAAKSGTTTLYEWIKSHQDVYLPRTKEILYFAKDEFYRQGEKYLDIHYKGCSGKKVIGGAYVNLMFFPYAAERIYKHNPKVKVLALLRNPVDRAYSAYWFERAKGHEQCNSFEEALKLEFHRVHGSYEEQAYLTYLRHGHYVDQLRYYFDLFGKEQVKVIFTEDMKHTPEGVLGEVFSFLGLSENVNRIEYGTKRNQNFQARIPWLHRKVFSHNSTYRKILRNVIPPELKLIIRENIIKKIIQVNQKPFKYPAMTLETRRMLVSYFRPYNVSLEKYLGMDLGNWMTITSGRSS